MLQLDASPTGITEAKSASVDVAPAVPSIEQPIPAPPLAPPAGASAQRGRTSHALPPHDHGRREPGTPELAKSAADALAQRRYVDAIEFGEEAISTGHDGLRVRLTLGTANLMLGRTREARRHFEAAIKLAPDNAEAAEGLAATAQQK
jgi:tetratricopeptide (TPR) repeat protein